MLEATVKNSVVEELGRIVGDGFVSTNQADLYIYAQDMTQAEPNWPDVVVMPDSVEQVQAIIRFANREKIPVTPYVAGGNIGGLTIPLKGGISLDLKRMNHIIEVNETDMYAVVEPGVTFGHMKARLEKHHPNYMYTYAFSPPATSVMCNALLGGLDNLSFRYGAASEWISGLEVVLPTGELVKIGSCAVSKTWQERSPLPDLAGLFIGWQGTTGVVTKMAVSIWPKPKYATRIIYPLRHLEGSCEFLKVISRTRIPDDITGGSFAWQKIENRARENHEKISLYPAQPTGPGDPEFVANLEVSGNTKAEHDAKVKVLEEIIKEELKDAGLMDISSTPSTSGLLPIQMLGVLSSGGGLTWAGSYGPMSNWVETMRRGCEIQDKYGFTRSSYTRILREGHFAAIRWLLPFNKEDPEMVKNVSALYFEQLDMIIEMGYIPYKTPFWAIRKLEERAGQDWVEFHRRIKKMLDPNNILNPGRWGAPQE
jgi:FAD/FMN-containing dehydrogenase